MRIEPVLDLQEGRVKILRSVAEEIERRHQQDGINAKPPMRSHDRKRIAACGRRLPARRFRNLAADIEHEQRRDDADHEHAAPADILEQQSIDDRGEKISGRIARLQQSRYEASRLRRNGFHGERRADAPFAAHRNAEHRAQHQKSREARREARSKFDGRIQQHVDHQSRAPSPAVGRASEQIRSDRPHRQGQQNGEGYVGDLRAELLSDVLEDEHQEKKVESIERPSQECRRDDVFLVAGPALKRSNAHGRPPGCGF